MSSAHIVPYLMERQRVEGISGMEMAHRIGISETNWSHARRGRRGLTVKQIERAIEYYPEIRNMLAAEEQVPA